MALWFYPFRRFGFGALVLALGPRPNLMGQFIDCSTRKQKLIHPATQFHLGIGDIDRQSPVGNREHSYLKLTNINL